MQSSINRLLSGVTYPRGKRTRIARENNSLVENATGYYPGPVELPSTDVHHFRALKIKTVITLRPDANNPRLNLLQLWQDK